jgi:hypothetical protein
MCFIFVIHWCCVVLLSYVAVGVVMIGLCWCMGIFQSGEQMSEKKLPKAAAKKAAPKRGAPKKKAVTKNETDSDDDVKGSSNGKHTLDANDDKDDSKPRGNSSSTSTSVSGHARGGKGTGRFEGKTYYETLGVETTATADQIKKGITLLNYYAHCHFINVIDTYVM